jgi:hypothetical protein
MRLDAVIGVSIADIPGFLSQLSHILQKEPERRMGLSKPRSGPPKKLTEYNKTRRLCVIAETPYISYEDLLSEVSYKVKKESIRRLPNV